MRTYFLDEFFLSAENKEQLAKSFAEAGEELIFKSFKTSQEVIDGAGDADGIILMAVRITDEVMAALPKLKFIGRCGIGVDNVDVAAATERGIVVCNVPDHCNYEVASHVFALMFAIQRQIPAFVERARAGGYANGTEIKCHRVKGQTLGILGYGNIGKELAPMALGVGMNVLVYDPYVKEIANPNVKLASSFDEVLTNADVISLHLPLTPETQHMIAMPQFKAMKKNCIFLNAARGPVVKTDDLIAALKAGEIAAAGIDVVEGEPVKPDHELIHMDNVIFTHHVGMYSEEAMSDMYFKLANQCADVLNGRWTKNIVNPNVKEKAGLK